MKTARQLIEAVAAAGSGIEAINIIEARDREVTIAVMRKVADRLWDRANEAKVRMDSDEYMGLGAAANLVEIMIAENEG